MPFKMFRSPFYSKAKVLLLALATSAAVITTGCGMGINDVPVAKDTSVAGLNGIVHGGPNAITQATVNLYATATAAYGTSSSLLATATSDANGAFTFSSALPCPAGQQAYVTIVGGQTGGNANNPQSLLMAALGPCAGISTSTVIYVSEVTTVAAGYALSNFMGISGSTVNISAPATNNAVTPSCTGTGSSMTCSASGLAHAFLNALNLANSVSLTGTPLPTGQAYTTVPGNSNSVVPTLLLNTLGNVLQACVNSTGGVAGDGTTACGNLFTDTMPPTTSTASPVTPTNTLQAVINLAKYPTLTPANVSALYSVATAQTFFTPALAAVPSDYSMAITYKGPTPATAFYTFFTVLDIADNSYSFNETGNGSGPLSVAAMTSNGTSLYQGPTIAASVFCSAGSPCAAGVDTVGHLWLANTTSTNKNVYEINTADGTLANTFALATTTAPNSAAVDKFNNVFVTSANITANDLYELPSGGSAFAAVTAGGTAETQTVASPEYIAVSPDGSVWNTNYNASNTTITYNQNTAGTATPAFANAALTSQLSSTTNSPYGITFDASGNAWVNDVKTLFQVAPGASTPTNTYTISGTGGNAGTVGNPVQATSARFLAIDGDGNIFTSDNGKNSVYQFYPGTHNFIYMIPCTGNSGTACITAGQRVAAARNVVTDSTGSIWVSDPSATVGNGNIAQIIGTAAPAWGQLSYGHPGVRP